MKKIVGIMAAAALATSAFAEINVSSWGRMDFIPLNFAGENSAGDKQVYSMAGANWTEKKDLGDGVVGKDGVSFSASSENAGMALDIAYAGSSLGVGDNANLWVKPVDPLKITFGKIDYNKGRQELAYGTFGHTWRLQGLNQGEGGFSVAKDGRASNVVVNFEPIENLWFDYAFGVKAGKAYESLWGKASFGVGYNIPDAANLRVIVFGKDGADQKNGSWSTSDGAYGNVGAHAIIDVGADITAVENLFLTVGASIPTTFGKAYTETVGSKTYTLDKYTDNGVKTTGAKDGDTTYSQEVIKASIGANYTLDMLTFHGFFDSKIGVFSGVSKDKDYENNGFGYAVGLGVDVAFNDTWTLITDARFSNDAYQGVETTTPNNDGSQDAKYNRGKFGGYVGLCQALTNATFDFGFEFGMNKTVIAAEDNGFTCAIPLQIQVSF